MKINKIWHVSNKMPKHPSLDQRIEWHLAHAKNCSCRPIPEKVAAEITRRSLLL